MMSATYAITEYPKTCVINILCAIWWMLMLFFHIIGKANTHTVLQNTIASVVYALFVAVFICNAFALLAGTSQKLRRAAVWINWGLVALWSFHILRLAFRGSNWSEPTLLVGLLTFVI